MCVSVCLCKANIFPLITIRNSKKQTNKQKTMSFPTPGDHPNPGIEPTSFASPALQADSLLLNHQGSIRKKTKLLR